MHEIKGSAGVCCTDIFNSDETKLFNSWQVLGIKMYQCVVCRIEEENCDVYVLCESY